MTSTPVAVAIAPQGTVETDCLAALLRAGGMSVVGRGDPAAQVLLVVETSSTPRAELPAVAQQRVPSTVPLLMVLERPVSAGDLVAAAGAVGAVSWQASSGELLAAVRAALRGEPAEDGPLAVAVEDPAAGLTGREREVLVLVAVGWQNDEIARNLGISTHTVRSHVQSIMAKLDVTHRHAAAAAARTSASLGPRLRDAADQGPDGRMVIG